MRHVEGLVTGVESRLNARMDEQSDLLHHLAGKVKCILESIPVQALEQEGTTNMLG